MDFYKEFDVVEKSISELIDRLKIDWETTNDNNFDFDGKTLVLIVNDNVNNEKIVSALKSNSFFWALFHKEDDGKRFVFSITQTFVQSDMTRKETENLNSSTTTQKILNDYFALVKKELIQLPDLTLIIEQTKLCLKGEHDENTPNAIKEFKNKTWQKQV